MPPDRQGWPSIFDDRRYLLYASSLRDKFGYVRFVGLPTGGGPEDTPIETLFVEPALSRSRIDPSLAVDQWPSPAPLMDEVINCPRLVVLGDPGSGKSTLLSWIVLTLLARKPNRLTDAVGPVLPLALVLRDLDLNGVRSWSALLERFIEHSTGRALGSAEQIQRLLHIGQVMVLVDGLDEAGGVETRRGVVAALQEAFVKYPRVRWIITSRVVGYEDAPVEVGGVPTWKVDMSKVTGSVEPPIVPPPSSMKFPDDLPREFVEGLLAREERAKQSGVVITREHPEYAVRVFVAPFDDARLAMFVRNWHEQHETDRAARAVRTADLLAALERSPQVKDLARTPNLLTMIALVYRVYVHLPDGRARLYDRIAQAYLETIEVTRKLPTLGHSLEDMKRWLGYAAFQMQRARFVTVERSGPVRRNRRDTLDNGLLATKVQFTEWVLDAMSKDDPESRESKRPTAEAFVDWVARRAGLILPRSEDLFAFAHLSFQEYFAAWFLAEQVQDPSWSSGESAELPLSEGADRESLRAATGDVRCHEMLILMFEILEGRGRWSNIVLDSLFDLSLIPADERPALERIPLTSEDWSKEALLVSIARDRHSGLSAAYRNRAFDRGWSAYYEESEGLKSHFSWSSASRLAQALLAPDGSAPSPALVALKDRPRALPIRALLLPEGATDVTVSAMVSARPAFANVEAIYLRNSSVTATGMAALTSANAGLAALSRLSLSGSDVTDAVIAPLAASNTGLAGLTNLDIVSARVGDAGVAALAAADTGLSGLVKLHLSRTPVTDVGLALLAAPNTGLAALQQLWVSMFQVSDAGIATLAAPNTGLKSLVTLALLDTQLTDVGLAALAAPESGLRSLALLAVYSTAITDSGVGQLAAPNTGLKDLTGLALGLSAVTDAGLYQLAAPTTGLKKLTHLALRDLPMTDAGLAALVGPTSGLTALSDLELWSTRVTQAQVNRVQRQSPHVKIVRH